MNSLAIIGDTNFYRTLCYYASGNLKPVDKIIQYFKILKKKEQKSNHKAFCNPFVLYELLSHLSSDLDKAYEVCKRSVVGLFEHCQEDGHLRFIADSELQLTKLLFDIEPVGNLDTTEKFSLIAKEIHRNSSDTNITKFKDTLTEISSKRNESKFLFVDDFKKFIMEEFELTTFSWSPLKSDKSKRKVYLRFLETDQFKKVIAKSFVLKSAILARRENNLSEDETNRMIDLVQNVFETPIELFIELLRRLAISGLDLSKKKRENYLFDIQIVFSISKGMILNERTPVLITNDNDIIQAANKVRCVDQCYSINRYQRLLKK